MNITQTIGIAIAITGLLSACNQPTTNYPVGIIDMERASQETGNTDAAIEALDKLRATLQQQLQDVQNGYQQRFQESQEKAGESPTDEHKKQLSQLATEAQDALSKAQENATETLKKKQTELFQNLHTNVQTVANRIARERGMNIVLLKNSAVILSNDEQTDITDAVIEAMKKQGGDINKLSTEMQQKATE